MMYTTVEILNHLGGIPYGFINHTSWKPQDLPLVAMERERWDEHQLVPWTGAEPVWVELTINNIDSSGHPFHLVSQVKDSQDFSADTPCSTALTSTLSLRMKGRVVGITITPSTQTPHGVGHSTSWIRFVKTLSMYRHGGMWLLDSWQTILVSGPSIVISCGMGEVACRWLSKCLETKGGDLVKMLLDWMQSSCVWNNLGSHMSLTSTNKFKLMPPWEGKHLQSLTHTWDAFKFHCDLLLSVFGDKPECISSISSAETPLPDASST